MGVGRGIRRQSLGTTRGSSVRMGRRGWLHASGQVVWTPDALSKVAPATTARLPYSVEVDAGLFARAAWWWVRVQNSASGHGEDAQLRGPTRRCARSPLLGSRRASPKGWRGGRSVTLRTREDCAPDSRRLGRSASLFKPPCSPTAGSGCC